MRIKAKHVAAVAPLAGALLLGTAIPSHAAQLDASHPTSKVSTTTAHATKSDRHAGGSDEPTYQVDQNGDVTLKYGLNVSNLTYDNEFSFNAPNGFTVTGMTVDGDHDKVQYGFDATSAHIYMPLVAHVTSHPNATITLHEDGLPPASIETDLHLHGWQINGATEGIPVPPLPYDQDYTERINIPDSISVVAESPVTRTGFADVNVTINAATRVGSNQITFTAPDGVHVQAVSLPPNAQMTQDGNQVTVFLGDYSPAANQQLKFVMQNVPAGQYQMDSTLSMRITPWSPWISDSDSHVGFSVHRAI